MNTHKKHFNGEIITLIFKHPALSRTYDTYAASSADGIVKTRNEDVLLRFLCVFPSLVCTHQQLKHNRQCLCTPYKLQETFLTIK